MVYPRQKLYDTNHSGYFKALIENKLNTEEELPFERKFFDITGIQGAIPLSRGRLGLYFAIRNFVSDNKNKVIMNSFTIFDVINMVIVGGGSPVFCDSESKFSPHITLDEIKKNADENTSVVVITHYHTINPYIKEISQWCKENDIKLIEDCAISFGSFLDGKAIGSFGDVSYFSFGLFKFISTYFGGAVYFKDKELRTKVLDEINQWKPMGEKDLRSYFFKGIKLDILTSKNIFNFLTFPLFKFGFLNDISFIKKQAVNDPDPHLKIELPEYYKRKAATFQIKEYIRQFRKVNENKKIRQNNAKIIYDALNEEKSINISNVKDEDCFLNFPIVMRNTNREKFINDLMGKNFDASTYFYRNCADLDCFFEYKKELPNIEYFVNNVVTLPIYPGIEKEYLINMSNEIKKVL